MIGSTILHYKILEKLGQGGMGVVYLAEDLKLERKVAIKFLPKHISENTEERQRFKIEAKAAAKLNHSNITTIYSIEETNNELFIVMEYIKGRELKEYVETGQLVPHLRDAPSLQRDEIIKIATQIADGLEAAHKEGIIHRDIKSSNIMITESGVVKIMDFGLAKIKGTSKLTKLGSTVGTIAYMSPEQTAGNEVDNRSDIWSFGVVLYEMLTGKMPFRGEYDQAIIYSILNEEPVPENEIDDLLNHVVSKSLAKNPDDRYQTAGEIVDELSKAGKGGTIKVKTGHSMLPWIIAGAVIIIIAAIFYFIKTSSNKINGSGGNLVKRIAVLPFVNMSADRNEVYFSDGLSGELISALAKNPKLLVISQTSSFFFKGKDVDIKTIASKLNVKNILEGSVQKSGNNLRITANLVSAETDATLWSNTYTSTMSNIFALQDSITGSVAEALDVALLGNKAIAPEQKTDPEAYNDYLLGNHFYGFSGKENLEKAADYYGKALAIDPGYAPALVNLSGIHLSLANLGVIPKDEGYSQAREEAEKAIKLNPNLAGAYSRIGWIKMIYDWDWTGADSAYKRGLEMEPGNSAVINGAATLAFILGRFAEAISLVHRLIEINPVSAYGYFNLGYYTFYAGSTDESLAAFKKCLEIYPLYPGVHMHISLDFLDKGKPDSALAEINKENDPMWKTYGLAIVYQALGKKNEADDTLAKFIKENQNGSAYQIAEIYSYRNEKDKAFEWLERAYSQRDGGLAEMVGDPLMRKIVKDSRYTAFMKKMKLPL
jgi:eukaryotic-like serine/threonine-protein kinase